MKYIRIIPRLDIKGPNVVKGIHMEGLRVLGKPEDFAAMYYAHGADELFFQDTVASLYQRNNLPDIITRTAKAIFIPLTVGGGLRSIKDIKDVLRAGADKVAINTVAINNPHFISEAANTFGASTIVVAIEAIKQADGSYLAYTDNGREFTGVDVVAWAKEAEERGAGEILITSIDKEGTGSGFDNDLIKKISTAVSISVIAHGGAGNPDSFLKVLRNGKPDAVAAASIFHYGMINSNGFMGHHEEEGNIEFIKQVSEDESFGKESIVSIKQYLKQKGIAVRG